MKVLKVVVLGADKVGKSSLLEKFLLPKNPVPPNLNSTLSKDIYNVNSKTVPFPDGVHRRVDFIDTSDLCEFPAMKRVYIQSGDAFVVVYAIDDPRSYEIAKALCEEIYNIKGRYFASIVLVGNKIDRRSGRRVSTEDVMNEMEETGLYSETSVKLSVNIKCPFIILFENYLQNMRANGHDIKSRRCTKSKSVCSQLQFQTDKPFRSRLYTV
uniref:GTP-binding protein Rit2-like n=1 Tax=Crassostrea virginica TaxID=6565 RepID=A0A8B8EJ25_CRAVI|nr:GTP-binding protein Rit2-like [Crassostrea virginica]